MKRVKDVNTIKGDLVKLKMPNGTVSLINKFQALHYAQEASMELYVEETDGIPKAEMRRPRIKAKSGSKTRKA